MAATRRAACGSQRSLLCILWAAMALPAGAIAAAGGEVLASPAGKLGTQVQDLPYPGLGRIVAAFVATVAVAIGVAVVLRHFWPALRNRRGGLSGSGIRVLDRSAVSATLTVSVVEVDGSKFLVAEGRGGVGVTLVRNGSQSESERTR